MSGSQTMRFCPSCGAQAPRNARFCMKCGTTFANTATPAPEPVPLPGASSTPVPMPHSTTNPIPMPPASPANAYNTNGANGGIAPNPGGASPTDNPQSKRQRVIIIAIMIVVALVIAAGMVMLGKNRSHETALAACVDAQTALANAEAKLKTAKSEAEKASKTKSSDVSDPQTIDDLKKLTKQSTSGDADGKTSISADACSPDLTANVLRQHTDDLNNTTDSTNDQVTAFGTGTQAVYDGQSAKTVTTSRSTLQSTVDGAQQLMTSSNGKVADDSTRTDLKKAIDEALKLLEKYQNDSSWKTAKANGGDGKAASSTNASNAKNAVKQMDASNSNVKSAMGKVNGSVSAKQAAEARKKAAEDQKRQAADTNRCASMAGTYAMQAVGVRVSADCSASKMESGSTLWSGSYVPQSFTGNGGSSTWRLSNGKTLTYYPAGTDTPVDEMTRNYLGADKIRNSPKIMTSDGQVYLGVS